MTRLSRTAKWIGAAAVAAVLMTGAQAQAAPKRAYVVIDGQSGMLLKGRRSTERLHPASLTKMMTLYLTFEALEARKLTLDKVLITSKRAAGMPASKLGLKVGDPITVRDAIRASAVRSANDAAVVLAEALGGTEAAFARKMTEKARELGLRSTSFKNATGLTRSGHLSTARDMARLARALYADFPQHYAVFSREKVRVRNRTLNATNRLLGAYDGADGIKTGYTRKAGFNLAAAAERDGKRVIAVYFGGRSAKSRDREVAGLLDAGFELAPAPARLGTGKGAPSRAPKPQFRPGDGLLVATPRITTGDVREAAVQPVVPAPAKAGGAWAVQVGAYNSRAAAQARLDVVSGRGAPELAAAFKKVTTGRVSARTIYRARFTGVAEAQARSACAYLKRNGDDCAVVPPNGWRQAAN